MRRIILLVFALSAVTLPGGASAGSAGGALPEEYIPLYDWVHRYILRLADAGVLAVDRTDQPFTRGEVAAAIREADWDRFADKPYAQRMIDRLAEEFAPEIELLSAGNPLKRAGQAVKEFLAPGERNPWTLHLGERVFADMLSWDGDTPLPSAMDPADPVTLSSRGVRSVDRMDLQSVIISKVGIRPRPGLYAYSGARFDSYLAADTTYRGTAWNGLSGYFEQAYISFKHKRFSGWIGKNWARWGAGRTGSLLLSAASRPYSGVSLRVDIEPVSYRWIAGELDPMFNHNRYFAVHRLDCRVLRNLQLGVSEMIVYGGANRTWELRLLNPLALWWAEMHSPGGDGNSLYSIDLTWNPFPEWTLAAELLIDDIQVEKQKPEDLEPDELGVLLTSIWADPLGLQGSRITSEFAAVTPRTYNSLKEEEKALHFDRPIGWRNGNDVIDWFLRWEHIFLTRTSLRELTLGVDFNLARQGEDRIAAPFDTTFLQYTPEQGYDEPFPTGTVETLAAFGADIRYRPAAWNAVELRAEMLRRENYGHQPGIEKEDLFVRLRLEIDLDYLLAVE